MSFEKFMNEALQETVLEGVKYIDSARAGTMHETVIFIKRENGDMFYAESGMKVGDKDAEAFEAKLEMGFYIPKS